MELRIGVLEKRFKMDVKVPLETLESGAVVKVHPKRVWKTETVV